MEQLHPAAVEGGRQSQGTGGSADTGNPPKKSGASEQSGRSSEPRAEPPVESSNDRTHQEVQYLKRNLGPILVAALAEICIRRPADPIEYLGHWLLRWRYNEELKRRDVQNALEVVERKTFGGESGGEGGRPSRKSREEPSGSPRESAGQARLSEGQAPRTSAGQGETRPSGDKGASGGEAPPPQSGEAPPAPEE